MEAHRPPVVIGVGASAGGVEALLELAEGLEPDPPATVLVVLHQPAEAPTVLPQLMDKRSALPVRHARRGDELVPGTVLLAPPDHHLLVVDGRLEVTRGPMENGHRPAVDPLFRSLALELARAPRRGGRGPGPGGRALRLDAAGGPGTGAGLGDDQDTPHGPPAGLACTDCSGPLSDLSEDHLLRYRRRVGHAWSEQSLSSQQDAGIERALFTALQALEGKADLQHRIASSASARGSTRSAARARDSAHDALYSAGLIRDLLARRKDDDSA